MTVDIFILRYAPYLLSKLCAILGCFLPVIPKLDWSYTDEKTGYFHENKAYA